MVKQGYNRGMKQKRKKSAKTVFNPRPLAVPLVVATGLSIVLFGLRVAISGNFNYWFINWNLFLAWLPIVFAILLVYGLRTRRWLSWQNLGLTGLWLLFLPNSFYMVTDFVHLTEYNNLAVLFDIVMFMTYALTGLMLGWLSVYFVHSELKKRKTRDIRWILLGLVFMLCSFAIFMGRNLGWNSWDVVTDPFGITLDLLQRLSYPDEYPDTYSITALFFVFIAGTYLVFYTTVNAMKKLK